MSLVRSIRELGLARTGKLVTSAALILMFALLVLLDGARLLQVRSLRIGLATGFIFERPPVVRIPPRPFLTKLLGEATRSMPTSTGTLLRVPQPDLHKDMPTTPPVAVV